jgi:hypothetical protein
MGRRSRRRSLTERKPSAIRDHQARVKVSDATWAAFREAAGQRAISGVLGELVEREVDRHHRYRATAGDVTDAELVEALDQAHELHAQLAQMIAEAERRLNARPPR